MHPFGTGTRTILTSTIVTSTRPNFGGQLSPRFRVADLDLKVPIGQVWACVHHRFLLTPSFGDHEQETGHRSPPSRIKALLRASVNSHWPSLYFYERGCGVHESDSNQKTAEHSGRKKRRVPGFDLVEYALTSTITCRIAPAPMASARAVHCGSTARLPNQMPKTASALASRASAAKLQSGGRTSGSVRQCLCPR